MNIKMAFSFRVGTKWCHDFPKLAKESGFYFNMHRSRIRIDWNRISNIDVDRIIREKDFHSIDDNINTVIDYCLESEYDIKILDPNFVKLFRLAQLSVEYLLYCKQYLDHSVIILKDELKSKIEENVKMKKEISTLDETIKHMKEKAKEKSKMMETKIGDYSGEIHKCPHCPKAFISPVFVSAHLVRRHTYGSNLYVPHSPIHERYLSETEKLHNEIKNLKERLNETERIIRSEGEKIAEKKTLDYSKNHTENGRESLKYDNDKSRDRSEFRGYQEEIRNLKTILFDEIHNLRQKEKNLQECTAETNLQALLQQQEKEIQKLRNQLQEKLAPDIESMQTKLQDQENYWKSKIEHLENQHSKDVEHITTELKVTQKIADAMKAEYESKVNDLEQQTEKQSGILIEQSKQLHSLTKEINVSQSNERNSEIDTQKISAETVTQDETNKSLKRLKQNTLMNTNVHKIVVGNSPLDVKTDFNVSNKEPSVASEDNLQRNVHALHSRSKQMFLENKRQVKQGNLKEEENVKIQQRKGTEDVEKSDSSDYSESQESMENVENESTKEYLDYNPVVSKLKDSSNKNRDTLPPSNIKSIKESTQHKNNVPSVTRNESISDSNSESIITMYDNSPLCERKTRIPLISKSKQKKKHNSIYKVQSSLKDLFEQKLIDLGIDPEWQGIPKITFKQKMGIVKHHQKLAAKKAPKYYQVRSTIMKELMSKLTKKETKPESSVSMKRLPPQKIMIKDKSKIVNVHSEQKGQKSNHPIKAVIEYKSPIKPIQPQGHSTIERLLNLSPNMKQTSQDMEEMITTLQPSARRDSINKMKAIYKDLFPDKTNETNKTNNLNVQQKLKDTFAAPKHNKSVLKHVNGSTSSLAKKRVLFDLANVTNEKECSDDSAEEEILNTTDGSSSIFLGENGNLSAQDDPRSSTNIVLKTTQSDKIAEIARKLETQLNMVRRKPVGSVETIFPLKSTQEKENDDTNVGEVNSSNISSVLGSPILSAMLNSKGTNDSLPQPAPRNLKDKISETLNAESISEISDLDSDIDKILKI